MFNGFSPETIDFLWGIRMNNNRDWFLPHKPQYVKTLYEPMKALGQDLFQSFLDKPGNLLKVSRIYRDARMHHSEPYKESLWICIRQDVEWWAENPCLFFEIRPEGISYGLIWWRPRVAALERFRQAIAAQPEPFLELMDTVESATGDAITAQLYKHPKQTDDARLERFFSWKTGISCTRDEPVSEDIFGPELGLRVKEYLDKLIPLYDYFNQFKV